MEGSVAQSANCHGFKRARWRRLWRQQIQDWLIAACQNMRILVRALAPGPQAMEGRGRDRSALSLGSIFDPLRSFVGRPDRIITPTVNASLYQR